jgi:hypothetical protein
MAKWHSIDERWSVIKEGYDELGYRDQGDEVTGLYALQAYP